MTRVMCNALRAADWSLKLANRRGGSDARGMEGRVRVVAPLDANAASAMGSAVFRRSAEAEYDHSLSLMCALRQHKICTTVYALQRTYNASHAATHGVGEASERAFDAHEAAKATCKDSTNRLAEIDAAARVGTKVSPNPKP